METEGKQHVRAQKNFAKNAEFFDIALQRREDAKKIAELGFERRRRQ
jgi:hypothetical protein